MLDTETCADLHEDLFDITASEYFRCGAGDTMVVPSHTAHPYYATVRSRGERLIDVANRIFGLTRLRDQCALVSSFWAARFDGYKPIFFYLDEGFAREVSKWPPVGDMPFATWWREHPERRVYPSEATFDPSGETPSDVLNLWRGWRIDPAPGDCEPMLTYVREVLASGDQRRAEYILAWLADLVQNPGRKPMWALCFPSRTALVGQPIREFVQTIADGDDLNRARTAVVPAGPDVTGWTSRR
ncbi:MAG: hypothetical protein D6811_00400, partial [Alphaproteobacteria bacterium]